MQAAAQELSGMGNNEHWVAFERIVTVLLASGALHNMDAQGMMPATPLGLVARDLQAKNPLWLAMALLHPAVQVRGRPGRQGGFFCPCQGSLTCTCCGPCI